MIAKRRPGAVYTTPRVEKDKLEVTSGMFNEYTTGSPLHIMIRNENVISKDYTLKNNQDLGHADICCEVLNILGFRYRGGGRFQVV